MQNLSYELSHGFSLLYLLVVCLLKFLNFLSCAKSIFFLLSIIFQFCSVHYLYACSPSFLEFSANLFADSFHVSNSWWNYYILLWVLSLQRCISCPYGQSNYFSWSVCYDMFVCVVFFFFFLCPVALQEPWKSECVHLSHCVQLPSYMYYRQCLSLLSSS